MPSQTAKGEAEKPAAPLKNTLVVALGYFGRGANVPEAARNCLAAGAVKTDGVSVIIASNEIEFIDLFTIGYPKGEPSFQTSFFVRNLGALLPKEER
jgi:hypothetical protein